MEQGFDRQHLTLCVTQVHVFVGVKMRMKCVTVGLSETSFL